MFEEIDPNSEAFETLKQFCFRIGEGRIEPQRMGEAHFMNLYHPTVPEAMLIVYCDMMVETIYIRQESSILDLDKLLLVHSFPIKGRRIFPVIVEYLDAKTLRYHYCSTEKETCIFLDVSREQYLRFKLLFDEKNPTPWDEK